MNRFFTFSILLIFGSTLAPLLSVADDYDLYDFDASFDLEKLQLLEQQSGAANQPDQLTKPYVIVVSLDGFRYDYPMLHQASTLQEMMHHGAFVERLIPSFPSKTFPNHYTLATGLYPANHGLIGNTFYSRIRETTYEIGDREAVEDGTWYGGTPLWVLAETQGMCAASFFWVGSEAAVQGVRPSYSFRYNHRIPYDLRIDQVIRWLELPEVQRPHLIFLYFSLTDTAGHQFGPEDPATGEAVRYVDTRIGKLLDYVRSSPLPINLIVTADHGMTEITNNINIHNFVDIADSRFVPGPMAMIYTESPEETHRIYAALQQVPNFDCYLQSGVPSHLNFTNPDRIGDIVLVTEPPNHLVYEEKAEPRPYPGKGTHGYNPYNNPDMSAIFIAEGPNIQPGCRLSPVENIHVYPFIASILGLEIPHRIDGRPEVLAPMLSP